MLATVLLGAFAGVGSAFTLSARDGTSATVYTSCKHEGQIALTFDDGPYKYIEQISDMMTRAGGHCTFFVNGLNWDCIYNQAAGLKYAYGKGHQIGSHTWSHADLTTLNATTMPPEITRLDAALEDILGCTPAILRPPYGSYNPLVQQVVGAHNKSMVTWDFDSGDSTGKNATESKALYKDQEYAGTLLALNHETSNSTVTEVIPFVLDLFGGLGYTFVTVSECLDINPYNHVGQPGNPSYKWNCGDYS
ncbi:carbohydrate esterase family 4 protein [Mycena latifolia]|nr:carbohydrate esterase family 4 protein [Mycena latifolia]